MAYIRALVMIAYKEIVSFLNQNIMFTSHSMVCLRGSSIIQQNFSPGKSGSRQVLNI